MRPWKIQPRVLKTVIVVAWAMLLLSGCKSCDNTSSNGYKTSVPAPRAAAFLP